MGAMKAVAGVFVCLAMGCSQLEQDTAQEDCDVTYPAAEDALYVLPYEAGTAFTTGLSNCSRSFHSAGRPDALAYDFDMPDGTPFIAARGGTVYRVVEDQPSGGGGAGNYVVIDHGDDTFGLYYHSPEGGIEVDEGVSVEQGERLGTTGRSGLAGYPHLHFIVVKDSPDFPYEGVPVTFRNAQPTHTPLRSYTRYAAE